MATRYGVVGGGIVGLAIARRITQLEPESEVTVLEKEAELATHQTGHNSGVAHAGLYYAPGSLKATLCRRGIGLLKAFCAEHAVPYEECGKLVVARDASELAALDEIERRATANGVPGLRRLGPEQMREVEPHVRGVSALHSPSTAIVDYRAVARAMAGDIEAAGGTIRLGFEVTGCVRRGGEVRLSCAADELAFDRVFICAGLQSDRMARLAGDARGPDIVPFRGEYYRLVTGREQLVRGLIYPVPDPAYPFLGVHFTRRIGGGVDLGPNAVLALAREGYRRRDVSLADLADVARSPGFRRLAHAHWRMGLKEIGGSLSARLFLAGARSFIPELGRGDIEAAPAGVRAQALDDDGSLVDDFRITSADGVTIVRNAPSPAATSSLAIAEYVVDGALASDAGGSRPSGSHEAQTRA